MRFYNYSMFWKKKKTVTMDFFVSIGAGINQLPLIIEAKNLGFHVIGIDNNSYAPGFLKCDLKIQESIENYEQICGKLRELLIHGDICGILTKSYGSAMRTTSYLAEKFNTPFLPFERSLDFIDKKKMKTVLLGSGIPTPRQHRFSPRTNFKKLEKKTFPVISKPATGHAKEGIRLCDGPDSLKSVYMKNRKSVFEEFITGDEIIAAGMVYRGKYHLIDVSDKERTPLPWFVDLMHVSPSRYYRLSDAISSIGQAVADAFEIATSPLIMEFIVSEGDRLFLIEAVPEFGGEFIPDILIPARTGYNVIREAVRAVTGAGFNQPPKKKNNNAVVIKYITGQDGVLASCNPEGPKRVRGHIFSRIIKEIGSEVKGPEDNHDRIGVVAVRGRDVRDAMALAEEAVQSLNIVIRNEP